MTLEPAERDALIFHLVFLGVSAAVLAWPPPWSPGWMIFALLVAYNLVLPLLAGWRGHGEWVRVWLFVYPLSLLQVAPDAYLAGRLGVLEFPDLGFPRIGPVSAFMALMWVVPLFALVYLGRRVEARRTLGAAVAVVAAVSLVAFVAAEATLTRVPVWQARGVTAIGPVALYVVPPEVLLGVVAFLTERVLGERSWLLRPVAAAGVMIFYLLSLIASHALLG